MRALAPLAVLLLTAVALAGCSGGGGGGGDGLGTLSVSPTTGGIRGVVVDQAIRPVEGATVSFLDGRPETATTDAAGFFAFTGLEPGSYGIKASHPFYSAASQVVEVRAGVADPPAVRMLIERLISAEPYMRTIKETGFIACSANIVGAKSEECGEGVGVPGQGRVGQNPNNRAQIDFFVDGPAVRTIIAEFVWEPSVEVGGGDAAGQFDSRVATNWTCDPVCGGNTLVQQTGGSPLYLRIDAEKLAALNVTADTVFSTFTWAEDNPGVLLEQEYDVFISTFYHLPAPEGWSFVAGDPEPF